jgi:hypothetical protein
VSIAAPRCQWTTTTCRSAVFEWVERSRRPDRALNSVTPSPPRTSADGCRNSIAAVQQFCDGDVTGGIGRRAVGWSEWRVANGRADFAIRYHHSLLFAGRTASLLLLFRTKATPGLLRNFAPRNDDPARSEAAGGRSQRWRNKGALQAFFQASPKLACFAPSFSKQIFGGFVGFQWVTSFPTPFDAFQIFRLRPPVFGRILPDFTMQFSRQRFHRGAATQIERILNLTDNPVFGKKYP